MTERKAVIKSADMAEEMQQDSIDVATQVFQFYYPSIKNIFLYWIHIFHSFFWTNYIAFGII